MNPIVIDCSLTMAWSFTDAATPYTEGVLDLLKNQTAMVPDIWHLEVANILLVGERRKRITPAQSKAFLEFLSQLPILWDTETSTQAFRETLLLAREHKLSAYDAAYLELAIRQNLPLASLDDPLVKAAAAAGVPVVKI